MIPVYKLERLPPGQRRRKLALLLASCERAFANSRTWGEYGEEYVRGVILLALEDPSVDAGSAADVARLLAEVTTPVRPVEAVASVEPSADPGIETPLFRACNRARHALLAAIGTFPAEWDLILGESSPLSPSLRRFYPGVMAYAEDIRSPFNVGSIFRTAEAFGAERLFVSPLCVSPDHSRAQRSAMGCTGYLPWETMDLKDLPGDLPVFSLETGGTPIGEFDFPSRGVVIIGSEELGVSPEGLARASYGRVSIPMTGIKASLNVGVAFGILMQAWTSYLACSASNPD